MAERFGCGHAVLPPPIELAEIRSVSPAAPSSDPPVAAAAWPVGIVGQNRHFPSEPGDGGFVEKLGAIANRLHIYDPGRFRYLLGDKPGTRFFERRPAGLQPFLAQLRCFVHRTSSWWEDTLGRELYGAMALGVPVLCPQVSVHAARIAHGIDGFLYETEDEATEQLAALRRDPALAPAIGRAARARMQSLFDAETQARRYRELIIGALTMVAA